jgi:rhodanese-related sulfurtransferase
MHRSRPWSLLAALMAMMMVLAACGTSTTDTTEAATEEAPLAVDLEEEEAPEEEAPEEEPEEAEAPAFDLVAAVHESASTLPEGWLNVGDTDAFKEAISVEGTVLIDVREESEFAEGHIPGAINIPIRTLTANLELIPTDRPVIVYCASGWRAGLAVSSLRLLGYDNVLAYAASVKGWTEAGEELVNEDNVAETFGEPDVQPEMLAAVESFLTTIPEGFLTNSVDAVKEAMAAGAVVVDVREEGEFAEGHIADAISVPLRTMASGEVEVPSDTNLIVHCKSGWRAALALPMYHVLGYTNMSGFPGSYNAWVEAGEPIES